jgi:hypothetical protein
MLSNVSLARRSSNYAFLYEKDNFDMAFWDKWGIEVMSTESAVGTGQ